MSKKKKKKEAQPPVITGHDARAETESPSRGRFKRDSDAPDGVSGNWS